MFGLLTNLTKAAVATALVPVAVVADIVSIPASSCDPNSEPFKHTSNILGAASECVMKAVKPE